MADLLVVEDNPDLAEPLIDLLVELGHRVDSACHGEEGLRRLDRGPLPDLILLDVEMPVLDGPGMAYRMLIEDAGKDQIPLILLSGVMDLPKVAARVGTPYFLSKPYRIEALLTLLDRALAERRVPCPAVSPVSPASPESRPRPRV
jgi:CheY-like chemotaxis protein